MKRPSFRTLLINAATLCAVLGGIIGLAPLGLYALGLSNIIGRPSPPASCHPTAADRARLERALRVQPPITVQPLTPWTYVTLMLEEARSDVTANGIAAASFVAQHYNVRHLTNRHSLHWDLSGAALTVWITRHWSSDEVLCAAAEQLRPLPPSRLKPY